MRCHARENGRAAHFARLERRPEGWDALTETGEPGFRFGSDGTHGTSQIWLPLGSFAARSLPRW